MAERFIVPSPSETDPSWAWPVPRNVNNVNNNRQLKMMVLESMEDLVSDYGAS